MAAHARWFVGLVGVCGLLTACAAAIDPPPVPDPSHVLMSEPVETPKPPTFLAPVPDGIALLATVPLARSWQDTKTQRVFMRPTSARDPGKDVPTRVSRQLSPEAVLRAALRNNTVELEPIHFVGGGAIARFTWSEGKIFKVLCSPNEPASLRLPPGEHLAQDPILNDDEWKASGAEFGNDPETYQQMITFKPKEIGLTARVALIGVSGRIYHVLLQSTANLSIPEVTWQIPQEPAVQLASQRPNPPAATAMPHPRATLDPDDAPRFGPVPKVPLDRIHFLYEVKVTRGHPPWVPVGVIDDGMQVIIQFKEPLSYTDAPNVFVRTKKRLARVDSYPWENGDPALGAFYRIPGLHRTIVLRDSYEQEVTITRTELQPAPFKEIPHAPRY